MRRLHPIFILILSIALAMGSVASALARGQPMAVGQMVICASGGGEAVVLVDADGNPVAHVSCPECLAGGAVALPDVQGLPLVARQLTSVPFLVPGARAVFPRNQLPAFPRGPPALA